MNKEYNLKLTEYSEKLNMDKKVFERLLKAYINNGHKIERI